MTVPAISLTWSHREPPLAAAAVAGRGAAADRLRIGAGHGLDRGEPLRVAASADWIVVIGDADYLPWADGAVYLGWESGLLVPTTLRPSVPAAFLRATYDPEPHGAEQLVVAMPGHVLLCDRPQRAADPARLRAHAPT